MKLPGIPPVYLIAAGGVAAALLWVKVNGAKSTGQALGSGAVNLIDGVIGGAVVEGAQLFGLPPTNESECTRAKREGRTWDASFACPATDFLSYLWK